MVDKCTHTHTHTHTHTPFKNLQKNGTPFTITRIILQNVKLIMLLSGYYFYAFLSVLVGILQRSSDTLTIISLLRGQYQTQHEFYGRS